MRMELFLLQRGLPTVDLEGGRKGWGEGGMGGREGRRGGGN